MTAKEALNLALKMLEKAYNKNNNFSGFYNLETGVKITLDDISQKINQALDELEKLKERDTVMKVTQTWEEEDNRVFDCPHCGDTWFYSGDSECWKFCPNCGQRLDWSEKDE
jgi:rubrerythrin